MYFAKFIQNEFCSQSNMLDAIYFIREVTLTYFLTLPQLHIPKPFLFI